MKINIKLFDINCSLNKYGAGVLENAIDEYVKNSNKFVSCNSNSTTLKMLYLSELVFVKTGTIKQIMIKI